MTVTIHNDPTGGTCRNRLGLIRKRIANEGGAGGH